MPSADQFFETKACELLARVFRRRGYAIVRNVPFSEYGVVFHIDGWDPKARVGFEFLSSEDDDHDDLTLKEYQTLMDAQMRGELAIFVIDEVEPVDADDLRKAAEEFLDEVTNAIDARRARRRSPPKKAKKAAVRVAAKPSSKRTPSKKPATKMPGIKKPGIKKPVAAKSAAVAKTSVKKRTTKRPR